MRPDNWKLKKTFHSANQNYGLKCESQIWKSCLLKYSHYFVLSITFYRIPSNWFDHVTILFWFTLVVRPSHSSVSNMANRGVMLECLRVKIEKFPCCSSFGRYKVEIDVYFVVFVFFRITECTILLSNNNWLQCYL